MKKLALVLVFLLLPVFVNAVSCNVSLVIRSDIEIFENNQKITFQNKINNKSFDYVIEYWVEDIDGKIIKRKVNTTNQNKKSFTPKNLDKDIIIKARIAEIGCDDVNPDDNFAEKRILFNGNLGDDVNLTHKTIKITFEINKDVEKLVKFASQIPKTTNKTININLPEKEYKNKEENKAKKALPYLFIILTTLLSIVLIWRR